MAKKIVVASYLHQYRKMGRQWTDEIQFYKVGDEYQRELFDGFHTDIKVNKITLDEIEEEMKSIRNNVMSFATPESTYWIKLDISDHLKEEHTEKKQVKNMDWEKIEDYLFDKYCVEGEDRILTSLMEEHDQEVRKQAIEEFVEKAKEEAYFVENTLGERSRGIFTEDLTEIAWAMTDKDTDEIER